MPGSRTRSSARHTAKASASALYVKRRCRELLFAPLACSKNGAQLRAVPSQDEGLSVRDVMPPRAVASYATRHQVRGSVIAPVTIGMVCDQHKATGSSALSDYPSHLSPAPVTGVPSGAYAVIEDFPRFSDVAILRRERMSRRVSHSTHARHVLFLCCHQQILPNIAE